jgi:membrane protease YdiL (CAAX protease family)
MLFVIVTILIQVFYVITAKSDLSTTQYFPYGYIVHISYYLSFLAAMLLFIGKFDFGELGLRREASWTRFLLIGLVFALLGYGLKTVVIQGTFGDSFYNLPYYLLVPAFIFLGLLIGLAEESAFRGYILKAYLEKYTPASAILFSSFLFGIYHINFLDLNYHTLVFWSLYVVQAFTGGILMATLSYKTGGNLISSINYHSSNVIIGQIILWTPLVSAQYLLEMETIINVVLTATLYMLRRKLLKGFSHPEHE